MSSLMLLLAFRSGILTHAVCISPLLCSLHFSLSHNLKNSTLVCILSLVCSLRFTIIKKKKTCSLFLLSYSTLPGVFQKLPNFHKCLNV